MGMLLHLLKTQAKTFLRYRMPVITFIPKSLGMSEFIVKCCCSEKAHGWSQVKNNSFVLCFFVFYYS
jgi:hypothetical protein